MRPTFHLSQYVFCVLLIGITVSSCEQLDQNQTANAVAPIIKQIDAETTSSEYTQTARTVYTYDGSKKLTRMDHAILKKYRNNPLQTSFSVTTDYVYGPGEYVLSTTTRSVDQPSGTGVGVKPPVERTTTTTYAYTDGRLTSYSVVETGFNGLVTTRTSAYAYSDALEQVQQTEQSGGGFSRIYTYKKGVLTDYLERNGTAETRPWTLANGVITTMTIPGGLVVRYSYDDQLRPTRLDEFVNGKQTRYTVWTNDAMKPGTEAQPVPKGFPVLQSPFGRLGVQTSEKLYFINEQNAQTQFFHDTQATNQANAQGFVSRRTIVSRAQNPQTLPQSTTTTETYTYGQ